MSSGRASANLLVLILILLAVLAGATWANFRLAAAVPSGRDFIPGWVGMRLFLTEGYSPYGEEVNQAIQRQVYGAGTSSGGDQVRFVYPLYAMLIFAPFALIPDYPIAQAVWMTGLEVALIIAAFLLIRLTRWRINPALLAGYLLFSLLWYHAVRAILTGNVVVFCLLFLTAGLLAIRAGYDPLAAFFLTLSTIKPNLMVLPVAFILLWSISQRRWQLFIGILGWMGLLIGLSYLLLPDWLWQNLRAVAAYSRLSTPASPSDVFHLWWPGIGRQISLIWSGVLIAAMLLEWFLAWGKDFRPFLWAVCLTLLINQWVGINTDPVNFILLFPGLALVFAMWQERWRSGAGWMAAVSMLLLGAGLWAIFLATVTTRSGQQIQHPILFFLFPAVLLFGLYWVRWWAVRTREPLLAELRKL